MNLNEEAKKLSPILKELCNCTYSNLENLYESDHADGDGFVDRASELLILLANRLTSTENAFDAAMREVGRLSNCVPLEKYNKLLDALKKLVAENENNRHIDTFPNTSPKKTYYAEVHAHQAIAEAEGKE